jgi:hypothetical protein
VSFQVVTDNTNRGVVAWNSPDFGGADMGAGYTVETINDDALYQWLNDNVGWPPYAVLGADGQSFTLAETLAGW